MIQDLVQIAGSTVPIKWRRNPKARRYILRFQRPGCVVATIPRGGTQREALEFLRRSQGWLEKQMAKPVREQTHAWWRGERIAAEFFDEKVARRAAVEELTRRTLELAAATSSKISRVSIRNQRTRWGSCSVRGAINLNWRLIQTPAFVVDYIILHELMHMRQMNHSAKFWAEVEAVCPGWREAERWIKEHGREIWDFARA